MYSGQIGSNQLIRRSDSSTDQYTRRNKEQMRGEFSLTNKKGYKTCLFV